MHSVMQLIVRRDSDMAGFAARIGFATDAFRASGATEVRVMQLGDGSVVVLGKKPGAGEVLGEEEGEEDGEMEDGLAAHFMACVMHHAGRAPAGDDEVVAMRVAVEMGGSLGKEHLQQVCASLERFALFALERGGTDAPVSRVGRCVLAAIEGIRLLRPRAP
jgi:hypothetical protein